MDIDLLSKMVKELILDNDKVILPGLGAFVAEIVPSTFSDKGYTINPPYRRLYFRSKPDEGIELAEFYAKSNSVDVDVAERIIKDYIVELQSVLFTRKTVVFPGLGRLRATKENNVFFVADEDLDIYPSGFGLEPISLKTHQETRQEVSAAVGELKSILSEPVPVPVYEDPASVTEEPVSVPEEPVSVPEPTQDPVADQMVEPDPQPELDPQPEPEAQPEPQPEPDPEIQPEIEQITEPQAEPQPEPQQVAAPTTAMVEPAVKTRPLIMKVILVILAVVVAVMLLYMLVGRLFPEWIDKFLYSPEELEIIRR
jgi:nucleoid DNA-binding protein